ATSFVAAMPRLAPSAAMIALLPPSWAMRYSCQHRRAVGHGSVRASSGAGASPCGRGEVSG
ncbi:MAG TPA: hypothetical protein VF413_01090, partial [Cellulomonas sp.]